MSKVLVYISGPISTGGGKPEDNIAKATLVAKKLMKAGFAVICPQWSGFTMIPTPAWPDIDEIEASLGCDHSTWLEQDKRIIDGCDVVYRMPGDSKGADIEVQYAEEQGIKVMWDLASLYSANLMVAYDSMTYQEMDWLQDYLDDKAIYNKHGSLEGSGKAYAESVAKPLGELSQEVSKALVIKEETTSAKGYISATGGVKDGQEGRGDFSLLPYEPLRQVAEHLRVACEKKGPDGKFKYARNNWRKGLGLARIVSALRRHAGQLGEENDDYHLPAILAEAMFACQILKDIKDGKLPKELDDVDGPYKALDWKVY